MQEFKKAEERPMVCDCGSTDIFTRMNVGWDIDEGGEEKQHIDTCRTCGMKRFWVERLDNLKPVKVFVDKWEKNGWMAAL